MAFLLLVIALAFRCLLNTEGRIFTGSLTLNFTLSVLGTTDSSGIFFQSPNGTFNLCFFNPPTETVYYLSVTYAMSGTPVWTANRGVPLGPSDPIDFTKSGDLTLSQNGAVFWSSGTSGLGVQTLELLETGNLVLLDKLGTIVWQSFDHPTDTLLPGQFLKAGLNLTSSLSSSDFTPGPYSLLYQSSDLVLSVGNNNTPRQIYWSLLKDNRLVLLSNQAPTMAYFNSSGLSLVTDSGGSNGILTVVSELTVLNPPLLPSRAFLQPSGNLTIQFYQGNSWRDYTAATLEPCLLPSQCGPYGVCQGSGQCNCPSSDSPAINTSNLALGCTLPLPNPCSVNTEFTFSPLQSGLDYFANAYASSKKFSIADECQKQCEMNCSCVGFFFHNSSGGCFLYDQLYTIQSTSNSGYMFSIKTPLASATSKGPAKYIVPIIIGATVLAVALMSAGFVTWWYYHRKKNQAGWSEDDENFIGNIPGLPHRFEYKELVIATDRFSKVVGSGGFGTVYEGTLKDKTRVAVKKLDSIGQGKKEFRAEVAIIGSIHHMHLVRLCGFCAEGLHRLLVYEFMPNGSLDRHLFLASPTDPILAWGTRHEIIVGTAKGLAYLHEDCREKIIHCDIKPENILLDENFAAKVSDFGLAKLVTREQSQVFTTMRGTRGYLAPEWLMNLKISEKCDVYSFGMVVLEIISGRKNFDSSETSEKWYFPAFALQQVEMGSLEELVDYRIRNSVNKEQLRNAIRIALLCIQEEASGRPTMGRVVQMIEGIIPTPDPPLSNSFAFRMHSRMMEAASISEQTASSTSDLAREHSISAMYLSGPR